MTTKTTPTMHCMSDDDAAYTALLTQLLSDSSSTRNARVHSWIGHQYDFVLSEQNTNLPLVSSRPPSPSPSSSLGAHRTFSIDRPDSPLLPRSSADGPSSPHSDACPSYDALFFPKADDASEDNQLEQRECERALRFIVQEMAHWKTAHSAPATPHKYSDKPLPAPPPSPTVSISQSASSRALRSRSSSMRISRLPSFTSTLSSDQTQPQDIFAPPLPASVIIHSDSHPDLVFRQDNPYPDGYPFLKKDVYHDQDVRLHPPQDDKDSAFPSPTLSNFSCTYSRDTCITTPCGSFPASPASATFATACLPENVALPSSPEVERTFFSETASVSVKGEPLSSSHTALPSRAVSASSISPASSFPSSVVLPPATDDTDGPAQSQHLRAALAGIHSESRWSIATTASLAPSAAEPVKSGSLLSPRTPSRGKNPQPRNKDVKTPKQRRFISLFSRFSPGRNDTSTASTTSIPSLADNRDLDDSDGDNNRKLGKNVQKKASLASIRMSFSLSRPSLSGSRPALSSPTEEIPPLPMSPTRPSMNTCEPPSTASVTKSSIPRVSSRGNLLEAMLPPIPGSASTVTTFRNPSQVSVAYPSLSPAASSSKASLLSSPTTSSFPSNLSSLIQNNFGSTSRVSLVPPASKRVSFQSNIAIALDSSTEEPVSIHPLDSPSPSKGSSAKGTPSRAKSIFRLTSKPKTPKARANGARAPGYATQEKPPVPPLPSSNATPSGIPSPTKFTPPSKLASVLAGQMPSPPRHPNSKVGLLHMSAPPPPKSKLPIPPSRTVSPAASRVPRSATMPSGVKVPVYSIDGNPRSATTENGVLTGSKLPTPSLSRTTRLSTVRGLWRNQ